MIRDRASEKNVLQGAVVDRNVVLDTRAQGRGVRCMTCLAKPLPECLRFVLIGPFAFSLLAL